MANGELLMANDGEAPGGGEGTRQERAEAGGSWGCSGSDAPLSWLESGVCLMAGGSVASTTKATNAREWNGGRCPGGAHPTELRRRPMLRTGVAATGTSCYAPSKVRDSTKRRSEC